MIPSFIKNRFWVKVISILLAVVVWSYISSNISKDIRLSVPLELKLGEGMMILDGGPRQIKILARGPSDVIEDVQSLDFTVTCDLSNQAEPGKVTRDISLSGIRGPIDVWVVNYEPKEVSFTLDQIDEKVLPVRVVTTGTPQEGYRVEKTLPNPSFVKITGAGSLLKVEEVVETVPEDVDVTGLNRSKDFRRVRLHPIGGMVPERMVNVYVKVGGDLAHKKYDEVPILVLAPATVGMDVAVTPQKVGVVLSGVKERLDKLRPSDIIVYVDVAGLKPARYELPLKANLPEGIAMTDAVPANCEVVIKSTTEMVPEVEAESPANL
ncbi:MAG: CdaR family protein [Candidatus Tritonobacter lacicola]|nr:CdaR family protein [Candidatus Tritonobacter lacicola]